MSHPRNGPLYHEMVDELYNTVKQVTHDERLAREAVGFDVATAS